MRAKTFAAWILEEFNLGSIKSALGFLDIVSVELLKKSHCLDLKTAFVDPY